MAIGAMSDEDAFSRFWACYPRKTSKGDARKAWIQTEKIRPPIEELLGAVEQGKRSKEWHKEDRYGNVGAFIPYPASYLRSEGWDNEYSIQLSPIQTRDNWTPLPDKPKDAGSNVAFANFKLSHGKA